ncbi:hypothetical protein ACET6Z_05615 [Aeromonas veronii]
MSSSYIHQEQTGKELATVVTLPHELQVAHWLYQQQRLVSSREAASALGGTAWSMWQIFSKIRRLSNIIVINEKTVRSKGGMQYLIRVIYIHPYMLDDNLQPHRQNDDVSLYDIPLTWSDLVSSKWSRLVKRHKYGCDT